MIADWPSPLSATRDVGVLLLLEVGDALSLLQAASIVSTAKAIPGAAAFPLRRRQNFSDCMCVGESVGRPTMAMAAVYETRDFAFTPHPWRRNSLRTSTVPAAAKL